MVLKFANNWFALQVASTDMYQSWIVHLLLGLKPEVRHIFRLTAMLDGLT